MGWNPLLYVLQSTLPRRLAGGGKQCGKANAIVKESRRTGERKYVGHLTGSNVIATRGT